MLAGSSILVLRVNSANSVAGIWFCAQVSACSPDDLHRFTPLRQSELLAAVHPQKQPDTFPEK